MQLMHIINITSLNKELTPMDQHRKHVRGTVEQRAMEGEPDSLRYGRLFCQRNSTPYMLDPL